MNPRNKDVSLSRRALLRLLGVGTMMTTATAFVGCGGGSDNKGITTRGEIAVFSGGDSVDDEPDTRALGDLIFPLLAVRGLNNGNGVYFGRRNAAGRAAGLLQLLFWTTAVSEGVRILYNRRGVPVQLIFLATGAFLTFTWDFPGLRCFVRSFSAAGTLLGGFLLVIAGTVVSSVLDLPADAPEVSEYGSPPQRTGSIPGIEDLQAEQEPWETLVRAVASFLLNGATLLSASLLNNLSLTTAALILAGRALIFWYFVRDGLQLGNGVTGTALRRNIGLPGGRTGDDAAILAFLRLAFLTISLYVAYVPASNGLYYREKFGNEGNNGNNEGIDEDIKEGIRELI